MRWNDDDDLSSDKNSLFQSNKPVSPIEAEAMHEKKNFRMRT